MHPLSTRTFFESGYNNLPWVPHKNQEDRFFADFKNLADIPLMDFAETLQSSLEELSHQLPELTLLDDGSVFCQALLWLTRNTRIQIYSLTRFRKWDLELAQRCSQDFGIRDARTLALLQVTSELQVPVIWPQAFLRVLNVSYQRSEKKEYGSPYWVYVESEKSHQTAMALTSLRLRAVENVLKISPEVFKSYFFHFQDLWHRPSFQDPHNDLQERKLFQALTGSQSSIYLTFQPPPLNLELSAIRQQQAAFPLRGFFRKYFQKNPNFNQLEDLFGSSY